MLRNLFCGIAALLCLASAPSFAEDEIISVPPNALTYETSPEGVGFAALEGARFEEAYMAMVKLPAGLISPPHIKTANMYGVMVAGEMVHLAIGDGRQNETRLPTGSFYKIPAGVPHISKCVSDIDCVTYLYQDGKFDFNIVEK